MLPGGSHTQEIILTFTTKPAFSTLVAPDFLQSAHAAMAGRRRISTNPSPW